MQSLAAVQDLINASLAQVSTMIPAVVLKYDESRQTVDVELAIKTPYYGDTSSDNPVRLLKVPVQFPQGSNWVIAGPLRKGDAVTLHFPQYDCDNWFNGDKNRVYEAGSKYYHDIDGAFAVPGAFTYNSPTRDTRFRDRFHIRQGNNYLTMRNSEVVLECSSGASKITMAGGQVTVEATHVQVNADVGINGDLDVSGSISAPSIKADGGELSGHSHGGIQRGSSSTDPFPIPSP